MSDSLREILVEAITAYDRPRAVAAALAAVDDGSTSFDDLYRLVAELLVDIGAQWQRGETEVWQEHLASGVARSIVEACATRVEQAAPDERTATVILAAPSNEYHDLGLRMLADRFILAGWQAHFLGANVPVAQLIAAIEALAADGVVLWASTHYHRVGLKEYVDHVTSSNPGIRVWVGGAAFARAHDGWPAELVLDPGAIPKPGGA
jgi:methanogenic corrinoid protein MtbC1